MPRDRSTTIHAHLHSPAIAADSRLFIAAIRSTSSLCSCRRRSSSSAKFNAARIARFTELTVWVPARISLIFSSTVSATDLTHSSPASLATTRLWPMIWTLTPFIFSQDRSLRSGKESFRFGFERRYARSHAVGARCSTASPGKRPQHIVLRFPRVSERDVHFPCAIAEFAQRKLEFARLAALRHLSP